MSSPLSLAGGADPETPLPLAGGAGPETPLPQAGGAGPETPLPQAGGAGGGRFKLRNTARAKALRNQATPAERLLWSALGNRRLNGFKFSRQMPVGPYFVDFLCREAKLIVELDGFSHDARQDHDQQRDHFLHEGGYLVLRFTNADALGNLDGVVQVIAAALAEKFPPLTPPASGRGEESAERKLLGISLQGSLG